MLSNTELKDAYDYLRSYGRYSKINPSVLEDLIQETFISCMKSFKDGTLKGWCRQVLKNKYLDHIKTNRDFKELIEDEHVFLPDVEEQIECKQLGIDLYNWPVKKEYKDNSARAEKARIRMRNLYRKRKAA